MESRCVAQGFHEAERCADCSAAAAIFSKVALRGLCGGEICADVDGIGASSEDICRWCRECVGMNGNVAIFMEICGIFLMFRSVCVAMMSA